MISCRRFRISLNNFDRLLSATFTPTKSCICKQNYFSISTDYSPKNEKICSSEFLNTKHPFLCTSRSFTNLKLPPSSHELIRSAYVPGKSKVEDTLTVRNENGLCILVLPLYSRNEYCRFVIKPLMHTLNDLIMHVKVEDPGIEKIKAYSTEGQLICNSSSCSTLLTDDFILQLNGLNYLIHLNNLDFSSPYHSEDSEKGLVAQLYMALNSREIYIKRQEMLLLRLEELQFELEPLEKNLVDIKELAERKARMSGWVALSLMGLQFGMLARLTWWEYSWDIMEPVTYFITYATVIAFCGYFVVTNMEYLYPTVHERQVLSQMHKIVQRGGFDLARYNQLCEEAERIKYDLRRLQDPMRMQLHPHHLHKHLSPLNNV